MNQKLTINVLGPLEVLVSGEHILIRNRRLRTLLAVLALSPGEAVPLTALIDAIWPVDPPSTATHQVRKALSSLREILPDGWDSIRTMATGYGILLGPGQSDYLAFRALVSRAQVELPRGNERADTLLSALRLWRGPPGRGDLSADSRVTDEAMKQWRLVLTAAVDMLIGLNREQEARQVAEMYGTLAGGDQSVQGLMRQTRSAVVTREATEITRVAPATEADRRHPGPRARERGNALPARDPFFSGRARELGKIINHLSDEKRHSSPTVLIHGPVGIGKSALAAEAAYRLLPCYPSGAFYLKAESPTERPLTEVEAVTQLLLQVTGMWQNLPAEPSARIALWRGRFARRASFLLVDNYTGDFDLRQIMPNGPHCGVIITSRSAVLGIGASLSFRLDALDDRDGGVLAERVLGAGPGGCVQEIVRNSHGMPSVIRGTCDVIKVVALGAFGNAGMPAIRSAGSLTPSGGYTLRTELEAAVGSLDEESRRFLAMLSLAQTPEYTHDLMIALSGKMPEKADEIIIRLICESFLLTSEAMGFTLPRALYEYLGEKREDFVQAGQIAAAVDRYRKFIGKAVERADSGSMRRLVNARPYPLGAVPVAIRDNSGKSW